MKSNAPIKGLKVLLRGFDPQPEAAAKTLLEKHGYQVVTSITLAESVLVGTNNASMAIEAAKKLKLPVTPWAEFQSGLGGSLPVAETATACKPAAQPALEIGADYVRILDQVLPRTGAGGKLVPCADQFSHLCLDGGFMRNARAVALGVGHGLPVALEGDTAASKTTAILWLAHLLNQPVVRLNLHGQTDTGELVGRYVPGDGGGGSTGGDEPAFHNRILEPADGVSGWSKCSTAVLPEKQRPVSWRFHEGYIPQAMRHGWWVILDELNLAEPQVLERLNSAIEQPPSLVLNEGDGTMFGPSGTVKIHRKFHLFATMNPADYAGRSVLSPAFRDRWLLWHQAEVPGETEFGDMLRFLVLGEQPEFVFQGKTYFSPPGQPTYPALGAVPEIRQLLPPLALFHSSLCQASGMNGSAPALGRLRRERYVFSRRTLLTCLQLANRARSEDATAPFETQLREAVEIAYLGRIRDGADRKAAIGLLRAAGLNYR